MSTDPKSFKYTHADAYKIKKKSRITKYNKYHFVGKLYMSLTFFFVVSLH